MDALDVKILNKLVANSRETTTGLARDLEISNVATQQRITKLEQAGIIEGYTTNLNMEKLGFKTVAYIGIFLEKAKHYQDVLASLQEVPSVLEAHFTTGTYSIFAKLYAKDNMDLMNILSERIQNIDGIARTETFISLHNGISKGIQLQHQD